MAGAMRSALVSVLVSLALCAAFAQPSSSAGRSLRAFRGTGTWLSIYDSAVRHPNVVVAKLRAHHIHTLYIEASNDRQRSGVRHPVAVARMIETAHAAGIRVVGWYLPSFVSLRADERRAIQGSRFRTPLGERFDAFALDIESTKIRSLRVRTARAISFARYVRAHMPARLALGAITIDPAGARYWNGYPFARLAHSVDVFLPMEYFTDRTHGVRRVAAYSRANVNLVRRLAGRATFPVHPIGGEAHAATVAELRAFLSSSVHSDTLGVSLWEYGETSGAQWRALARF